jgi:hypothetical protein
MWYAFLTVAAFGAFLAGGGFFFIHLENQAKKREEFERKRSRPNDDG